MKARFSLVLTLLLLQLSAFSSKENAPPTTPQKRLLGTWELAKYVHQARSSAGALFRKDSTLIARPSTFLVTFHADGTVERPSDAGDKETYAYPPPTITFYYNGVAFRGSAGVAGPGNGGLRGVTGRSPQPAGVAMQRRSRAGHQLVQFHARQDPAQRREAREANQGEPRYEQRGRPEQEVGVELEQGHVAGRQTQKGESFRRAKIWKKNRPAPGRECPCPPRWSA